MPIFGKETAADLDIVKSLNDELAKSEDLMKGLEGSTQDLGKSLLNVGQAHKDSNKWSEKNKDIAKSQSRAGKDILNVLR